MHFFKNNRTFIVINPRAGTRGIAYFRRTLRKYEDVFDYSTFTDVNEFRSFIKKNLANYDFFIAAGGDGTVNSLAAELMGTDKVLGVIPYGSGNGFAREMGFKKNIKVLAECISRGQVFEMDVLFINHLPCINVAGTGIDSFVAHDFNNLNIRGFFTYGITTLRIASTIKPFDVEIKLPSESYVEKVFMLSVANTRQFGNNAIIAPAAVPDDGKFDIVLLKPLPKILFPVFAIRLLSGKLKESKYIKYFASENVVKIKTSEKRFHIDGEAVLINDEITISIRKHALKVLKSYRNRWVK
jgi:YegS/Rv2252/BmrU family lipid kinase